MNKTNLKDKKQKRNALKAQLDQFATFKWGNTDMFDAYGAFIINENKGSLKFYNGPQFSNQYGKTQWGESNYLLGVTFNTAKIEFTIGLYYFTIEEYQKFLHDFNPYRIDNLSFSFNSNWRYLVKPTQIPNSTRYVVGNENGEPCYYTEVKMTFEIQGIACARYIQGYEYKYISTESNMNQMVFNLKHEKDVRSFLETPIDFNFSLPTAQKADDQVPNYSVSLIARYKTAKNVIPQDFTLFSINFNELVLSYGDITFINLRYLSEEGVLLFSFGNMEEDNYLLNLQSSVNGQRLVKSCIANKFVLPGTARFPEIDILKDKELTFILKVEGFNLDHPNYTCGISSFPRTNII